VTKRENNMIEHQTDHEFEVVSKYKPTGDQPQAIEQLVSGLNNNVKEQILRSTFSDCSGTKV